MTAVVRVQVRTGLLELILVTVVAIVGWAAGLAVTQRLVALAPSADCARFLYPTPDTAPPSCPLAADFLNFQADWAGWALTAISIAPIIVGVVLGSQLVARELERGTASLAWTLDPGRRRWFIERIGVAVVPVIVAGLVAWFLSDIAIRAQFPGMNVDESFSGFGMHGPIVLVRGITAFGIGVATGTVFGRTVPALLVTGLLVAVIAFGSSQVATVLAGTIRVPDIGGARDPRAIYVADVLLDSQGRQLTFDAARSLAPAGLDSGDLSDWVYTHFEPAAIIIPGSEAPLAGWRDDGILGGVTVAGLAVAALSIRRRRPD
jgi:hypothetical protein